LNCGPDDFGSKGVGSPGSGSPGVGAVPGSAEAGSATEASGAGSTAGASTTGPSGSAATDSAAVSDFAAVAFFRVALAAGFSAGGSTGLTGAGKASLSLRTTGASTVDDGPLTYSPSSFSFARRSLLDTPSSFAISWTRGFATTLLSRFDRGRVEPSLPSGVHFEVLIGFPSDSRPVRHGSSGGAPRDSASPETSAPGARKARPIARPVTARARHSGFGCTQAPLPGALRRSSITTLPSLTISLTRTVRESRFLHPTHVRVGPLGLDGSPSAARDGFLGFISVAGGGRPSRVA